MHWLMLVLLKLFQDFPSDWTWHSILYVDAIFDLIQCQDAATWWLDKILFNDAFGLVFYIRTKHKDLKPIGLYVIPNSRDNFYD